MRLILENLWLKIASLLIAVLWWMATVGGPESTTAVSAPVQLRNLPQDLELSSPLPENAYIEMRGTSRRLTSQEIGNALVVVDLGTVDRAGERTFSILAGNVNLPPGVEFLRSVPSQLRLKFESRLTKEVPVLTRYAAPPSGYHIVNQLVSPAAVKIVGPESRVAAIDRVQTDPIELAADEEEHTFHVHGFAGDAQVRLEQPGQIFNVKVRLEKDR